MEDDFDFTAGGDGAADNASGAPQDQEEGFETLGEESPQEPQTTGSPVEEAPSHIIRRASSDAHVTIPPPSDATNKWKADNEKKIKQRDTEFAKAKQDMQKKAEQTLEKIRSERAQLIAKNARANRDSQAKAQAAANVKGAPGAPVAWQRLSQLVDLEKETTDKERMRLLLKAKVSEAKA